MKSLSYYLNRIADDALSFNNLGLTTKEARFILSNSPIMDDIAMELNSSLREIQEAMTEHTALRLACSLINRAYPRLSPNCKFHPTILGHSDSYCIRNPDSLKNMSAILAKNIIRELPISQEGRVIYGGSYFYVLGADANESLVFLAYILLTRELFKTADLNEAKRTLSGNPIVSPYLSAAVNLINDRRMVAA